jgi:hypothetical protein
VIEEGALGFLMTDMRGLVEDGRNVFVKGDRRIYKVCRFV